MTVGMRLETINGKKYASFDEGVELLKNADGKIILVASHPTDNLLRVKWDQRTRGDAGE